MSAHVRRRGRHAVPRPPVLTAPSPTGLGGAMVGAALTASLTSAPASAAAAPATLAHSFPMVPHVSVRKHPATPFGLPARIDPFATLTQQTRCDPSAKPGVLGFEHLVLATYPDTGSDGIVRACGIGGRSEHKEGRAWDWRVSAYDPHQAAEAAALLRWLLRPDAAGDHAAMARRLGVMYIIWNHHIWGSYHAAQGWRVYTGPEGHTDHVHFSFSWAGALKKTTFWHRTGWRPIAPTTIRRYAGHELTVGARGPAVRPIQWALGVRPSGVFGPRTQAAVLAFQRSRGLGTDGIVGPRTWHALGAGWHPVRRVDRQAGHHRTIHAAVYHGPRRPPPPGTWVRRTHWPTARQLRFASRHVLQTGSVHWPVGAVQRLVGVRLDGVFGPATTAAVERYQRVHHLGADGVVGRRTWRAMEGSAYRVALRHWIQERAAVRRYVAAIHRIQVNRFHHLLLRQGSHGPAVRYLQRRLHLRPDGSFDARTAGAVRTFQRRHRLVPDGQVGPLTWHALG